MYAVPLLLRRPGQKGSTLVDRLMIDLVSSFLEVVIFKLFFGTGEYGKFGSSRLCIGT